MNVICIHRGCSTEVRHIVSSSTNPGVLFATCDSHVREARVFVSERFMGRIFVSDFVRVPRLSGTTSRQAA